MKLTKSKLKEIIREELQNVKTEAKSINVEPNWRGVYRFFKHMEKTNPGDFKKIKVKLGSEWDKLEKMAQHGGWQSETD